MRPPWRGSVSVPSRSPRSEFRPTQPTDKRETESVAPPVAEATENHPPPVSRSVGSVSQPDAGQMPEVAGIQREYKKNGVEAWHTPEEGKRGRSGKTYLGKIGRSELAGWSTLPPAEFLQMVAAWIELKRRAKGIA